MLLWVKQMLVYFKLKRSGIGNEFSYIKSTFSKDSSYKCQFCTKVWAPSRLVSKFWAICKDSPTKILKRDARKTKVNKKRVLFEQYRQTNQRMMNVRKKQFKRFEISGE